ncbi:MAG: hypothetical protein ACREYD_00065, partial [Casimicrobiaceae bacterium]
DLLAAFLAGAVGTLKESAAWETDEEPIDTMRLIEAARELAARARGELQNLVDRLERGGARNTTDARNTAVLLYELGKQGARLEDTKRA